MQLKELTFIGERLSGQGRAPEDVLHEHRGRMSTHAVLFVVTLWDREECPREGDLFRWNKVPLDTWATAFIQSLLPGTNYTVDEVV